MRRLQAAICLVVLVTLAFAALVSESSADEKTYAVLVVGDNRDKTMTAREKDAIRALVLLRERLGVDRVDLPLISYHVNKPQEKAFCEKTLGIKPGHLLFVGLVEHEALVARKVLFRANDVTNGYEGAMKVMTQAARVLGKSPSLLQGKPLQGPSGEPSASPSPSPSPGRPEPGSSASPRGVSGVALAFIEIVNHDGQPQTRFAASDRGVYINVYLKNAAPEREHRHELVVKVFAPDGKMFGRPLGGPFTVAPGENLGAIDMLKRADREKHNGYLIADRTMGRNPGTYRVVVEVDGRQLGKTEFEVGVPSSLAGPDLGLEVEEAWLADDQGTRRYRYSGKDSGVYVFVRFRNTAPVRRQQHVLKVTCTDVEGRSYGRPLGGAFVVEPQDTLVKKDFPREADEERHNGFLISGQRMGKSPGSYRVVIEVDQRPLRVMHFRVTE